MAVAGVAGKTMRQRRRSLKMNQITPATPGEVPKTSRHVPTKPPLYSVALMRAALIDARGLKSRAAVILGCNRRIVNEYISRAAGHAARDRGRQARHGGKGGSPTT